MDAIFREIHALRFNIQPVYVTKTNYYSILHLDDLDGKYFVVNLFSFIFETAAYRTQSSVVHVPAAIFAHATKPPAVNTIKLVYNCMT